MKADPAIPPAIPPGGLVSVMTPLPIPTPLDYRAPVDAGLRPGDFALIQVGGRSVIGVVWGPGAGRGAPGRIKSVERKLDLAPMTAPMRAFLDRAADYTVTPTGLMLRLATRAPGLEEPPGTRKVLVSGPTPPEEIPGLKLTAPRARALAVMAAHPGLRFAPADLARLAGVGPGVLKGLEGAGALIAETAPRDAPFPALDPEGPARELSMAQAEAAAALRRAVAAGVYATLLLKGVTGSGKTEVYLEAVAECLRQGRQALILLPEIALTAAFLRRIEERFGARPAEWHSEVSGAGRRRCWRALGEGEAQVVVGARSALFLPFRDLGLIVVDEEHDSAYKQEDGVLYHARDMAVLRASICGATVALASATPSLESWVNAEVGKYRRIDLPERFGPAVHPVMRAIDIRADPPERGAFIAPSLARAVADTLARGEQALLFVNRRGYAPLTLCRTCGHRFGCPHCDAWLVEHRSRARLICHQCGYAQPAPKVCPTCGKQTLAACGPGVERLAEETAARFPQARIALLSSDLAPTSRELKAQIDVIARGEADIIVGTQIVAKGHNFPLLTLVGAIDADLGLQGGDLRAAERTFQLVRQVAGRAGRGARPGAAYLQTVAPDHPVMRAIVSGDEEAFWRREAEARRRAGAPPYGRMVGVIVSGPDEARVQRTAGALARAAEPLFKIGAQLFGPAPAPFARLRGKWRARLLVKVPKGAPVQDAVRAWASGVRAAPGVRITFDIDPQSFL